MTVRIANLEHALVPNPGVDDHKLTVSTTVLEMPSLDSDTKMVFVTVEDGNLRATFDGEDPTADNGHFIGKYAKFYWNRSVCESVKLLRDGSSDAVLRISEMDYYETNPRRTGIRAVTFNDVFNDLIISTGTDPDEAGTLSTYDEKRLCRLFNKALADIWTWCMWPELTVVDERTVVEDSNGTRYVPRVSGGHYNIGRVYNTDGRRGVSVSNPRANTNPNFLNWSKGNLGIVLHRDAGDEVWVEYRIECPKFTRTAYNVSTSYSAGDIVYWSSTGECYQAVEAHVGHTPADSTYWTQLELPWMFQNYVVDAAHADWLLATAKREWGLMLRSRVEDELLNTVDRYGPQENAEAVVE